MCAACLVAADAMKGCHHDVYGTYLWTAGQRIDPNTESDFVWKVTPSEVHPLQYTNWDLRQPDFFDHGSGKESCLNVWPGRGLTWNDERCSIKMCFICMQ